MEIILKLISSHTKRESDRGIKNLTKAEKEYMEKLLDGDSCVDLYYDGENITPDGDLEFCLIRCFDGDLEFIKDIDKKVHIHSSGFTEIEDITRDVLYSLVDTSFYGYKEGEVIKFFNRFRNACLTKDCILDKILELGINSLTEEDKKILEDEKNIHL